jgi:ectoine hydroxylase-related dioxygenase (phytanoyl-CoA dioxygenase family)
MKPFYDSTPLLKDSTALRSRFEQDGYCFIKGAIDPTLLKVLNNEIIKIMDIKGWLKTDSPADKAVPGTIPHVEGEEEFFRVYDEVQRSEAFHSLPHHPQILSKLQALLGNSAFPHPLSIARLVFPDNNEWATPPHQDYANNQGTEDLYACWIPLSDCPQKMGSLSILEGSHKLGLLPLKFSLGAGHRQADIDERIMGLEWLASDFAIGDILIFHSLTIHQSLPNISDVMRLSVDYRFQREHESLTENCLLPHFKRLLWDDIYRGWKDKSLSYYWQKKQFDVVSWDAELHKIPADTEADAIRQKVIYDRKRKKKNEKIKNEMK